MRLYFDVIAALLLTGACWLFMRRWRVASRGILTQGHVVAFERREDDGSCFHLPVVEFTDGQGVVRRFTSVAGHADPRPPVGTRVGVRYVPGRPEVAFITGFLHMWAAPLAMFVLGIASLAAGLRW